MLFSPKCSFRPVQSRDMKVSSPEVCSKIGMPLLCDLGTSSGSKILDVSIDFDGHNFRYLGPDCLKFNPERVSTIQNNTDKGTSAKKTTKQRHPKLGFKILTQNSDYLQNP